MGNSAGNERLKIQHAQRQYSQAGILLMLTALLLSTALLSSRRRAHTLTRLLSAIRRHRGSEKMINQMDRTTHRRS
jgi:hypothetical protein